MVGADLVVTEAWVSMNDNKSTKDSRHNRLLGYQVNEELMAHAKPDAIVMHPGPMNRGVEIDGELADDINRSVIQDQVEMGVAVRMAAMDLLARNQRNIKGAA